MPVRHGVFRWAQPLSHNPGAGWGWPTALLRAAWSDQSVSPAAGHGRMGEWACRWVRWAQVARWRLPCYLFLGLARRAFVCASLRSSPPQASPPRFPARFPALPRNRTRPPGAGPPLPSPAPKGQVDLLKPAASPAPPHLITSSLPHHPTPIKTPGLIFFPVPTRPMHMQSVSADKTIIMDTLTSADALAFHSPSPSLLDTMASPSSTGSHFLCMEDLHTPSTSPPPPTMATSSHLSASTASTAPQSSPAPVIVHSKAAKKRKSWGQELPQPKTNLPPRKRAKTDDEKEQRRIERIKRNRAAAHNSRERKRQEAESLAVALAHANAELEAYRRLHGPLPADVVLPEVTVVMEGAETPVPSLTDSRSSVDENGPSPASPVDSLWHHALIKQEPTDNLVLPSSFDALDAKSSLLAQSLTQHSAEMLCDLPCQFRLSSSRSRPSSSNSCNTSNSSSNRSSMPPSEAASWATLFLYLHTLHLRTCYQTLLLAFWSSSRSSRLPLTRR